MSSHNTLLPTKLNSTRELCKASVEFPHVTCRRFLMSHLVTGETVLDIGCGRGELMREQLLAGCTVVGTEIDRQLVDAGLAAGLDIRCINCSAVQTGGYDSTDCGHCATHSITGGPAADCPAYWVMPSAKVGNDFAVFTKRQDLNSNAN